MLPFGSKVYFICADGKRFSPLTNLLSGLEGLSLLSLYLLNIFMNRNHLKLDQILTLNGTLNKCYLFHNQWLIQQLCGNFNLNFNKLKTHYHLADMLKDLIFDFWGEF